MPIVKYITLFITTINSNQKYKQFISSGVKRKIKYHFFLLLCIE